MTADPMSLLEQRFRTVLRMLPAWYRAEREDEMVASFLEAGGDVDDEDNPKPRWSEIASVAALALRVRLGDAGGRPPRLRWGEAVRLVAALGLLYQAALGCWALLGSLRLYTGVGVSLHRDWVIAAIGEPGSPDRLAWIGWVLVDAAVVAAYLTLLGGHRRIAKILALLILAYPARAVGDTIRASFGLRTLEWDTLGYDMLASLLALVTVAALYAGFHRAAPALTHTRRWLAALPAVAAPLALGQLPLLFASLRAADGWLALLLPSSLFCLLLAAATIGYACLHVFTPQHRTPSWPLALALLAAAAFGTVLGQVRYPSSHLSSGLAVATSIEAGAAATTCLVLIGLARHASRSHTHTPGRTPARSA